MKCNCGATHNKNMKCKYNGEPKLRESDLEKKRKKAKEYYNKNSESILEKQREYYDENNELIIEKQLEYYHNGGNEVQKNYKIAHSDEIYDQELQRRIDIMNDPIKHEKRKKQNLASYYRNKNAK